MAEGGGVGIDLSVRLDAAQPAKIAQSAFKGGVPPMAIEGDAAFAADFSWIAQNVRWDAAGDAERFFGPLVAEGVSRASAGFAQAAELAKNAMGQVLDALQPRKR